MEDLNETNSSIILTSVKSLLALNFTQWDLCWQFSKSTHFILVHLGHFGEWRKTNYSQLSKVELSQGLSLQVTIYLALEATRGC